MELTLDRSTLVDAVAWSSRTISQRPAVPVLAGVRISTVEGLVEFASYDFEVSSRVRVAPKTLTEEGEVLVDGKLLSEYARAMPGTGDITFKTVNNSLEISCGSFRAHLLIMPTSEYPSLPVSPQVVGRIEAATLANAVSQVAVASSKDDTMPLLTGISIEIRGEKLYLLATDRYRMALKELQWDAVDTTVEQNLVVKAKNLSDAVKNIASAGVIEIATETGDTPATMIGLTAGGRVFTSQVNDGAYPDVRRLFPDPINITAVVKVSDFVETAKRVAIVSSNQSNQQITLSFSAQELQFRAGVGGENTASDVINATLEGSSIEVSFNSRMLLEGVSSLGHKYARFSFKDDTKPAIITGQDSPEGEDFPDLRYLIMPIRTSL